RADGEPDRSTQTRGGRAALACEHGNAKNNKALARVLGCFNPARGASRFFLGLDIGPTRTIQSPGSHSGRGSADRPLGSGPQWVGDLLSNERRQGEELPHFGYPPSRVATYRRGNHHRRRWVYEFARLKAYA